MRRPRDTRRLFDTSYLIDHWIRRSRRAVERWKKTDVRSWANELCDLYETDAIVTPVRIKFICGATSVLELDLSLAFLAEFKVIDDGSILTDDWVEAERIAKRVPRRPKPRQMGDCLIRAIANRLRFDVLSSDSSFPS